MVDGIIIASTGKNTRLIRDIKATGISVIQLIRTQDKSISSVVANYRQTAYSSCEYLIDKGCKKIGFINGNMQIIPFKERYLGYRESIKNHELKEYLVKSQTPRYDNFLDGYNGALNLIEKDVDAIITALDMQGLGAIRALKESDKKVPDEVKVISLTGHSIGAMLETKLTSLEIPVKKLAKVATEMLIEEISTDMKLKHKVLKAELIERETT